MPKWNDALERKLLLCIITYAELKTISWDKIAELMGDDVSSEACRYVSCDLVPYLLDDGEPIRIEF